MIEVLMSNMAWLPKKALGDVRVFLLKKNLTLIPKVMSFGKPNPEEVPKVLEMWRETTTHLGVPRGYFANQMFDASKFKVVCETSLGRPLPANSRKIVLRKDDQQPVIDKFLAHFAGKEFAGGIIEAYTGYGKCLKKGTLVLMANGTLRPVEELQIGDQLMGPDSKPRNVLSLGAGSSQLYEVRPKKGGQPFVCNGDHILHLKVTGKKWNEGKSYGSGSIHQMSVDEYLRAPAGMRHLLKLVRVAVDFPPREVPFSPHMIGMWLGDGDLAAPKITSNDREMDEHFRIFASDHGLIARKFEFEDRCCRWSFTTPAGLKNPLWTYLKDFCQDSKGKLIPEEYLLNSSQVRMELLAGLVDSDGYFVGSHNYEITSKCERLAKQIVFLIRSLGFGCTVKQKTSGIASSGFSGVYWRISFWGDTAQIPARLARKRNPDAFPTKDWHLSGFEVESVGIGDYFGFTIDGDHLFLLEDFTVSHNTTAAIRLAEDVGRSTLILVHKNPLKNQWIERIKEFYPTAKIGVIQGSKCQFDGYDFVIGMCQSMMKDSGDKYPEAMWSAFGLVIADEVHRHGAQAFSTVALRFTARYILGLSATPYRADGCAQAFRWVIGEVMAKPKNTNRVKPIVYVRNTGFVAVRDKYDVKLGRVKKLDLNDFEKPTLLNFLASSKHRNKLIAADVIKAVKSGRNPLVMSERLDMLYSVANIISEASKKDLGRNVSHGFYVGGKTEEELQTASAAEIVYTTVQLAKEGIDISRLDTIFLGSPFSDPTQAVGRIGRTKTIVDAEGNATIVAPPKRPMVVDYADFDIDDFKSLYFSRLSYYKREGFEVIGAGQS